MMPWLLAFLRGCSASEQRRTEEWFSADSWRRDLNASLGVDGLKTGLTRTVLHGEHALALNPTANGLRFAGTIEFAGVDAPPNYERARTIWHRGRPLLRDLQGIETPKLKIWMGRRPTMPDYRPVIGLAPGSANRRFAFGHRHLGLTLAARTGEILVDFVGRRDPGIDLQPFRASRF